MSIGGTAFSWRPDGRWRWRHLTTRNPAGQSAFCRRAAVPLEWPGREEEAMTSAYDFRGKAVFVAGGSSGINLGIAEAFAVAGANLAIVSRSAERVERASGGLRRHGVKVLGQSADVRDYAAISA